ncbi:MAG: hypothetical protein WBA10_21185 [Elainellaceae cyanobacterium]
MPEFYGHSGLGDRLDFLHRDGTTLSRLNVQSYLSILDRAIAPNLGRWL